VPKFKHSDGYLHDILDCPPTNAKEIARTGFHFVSDPVDSQSFLIPAERDTERFEESPSCPQCGLSMYTRADRAKAAFKKLLNKHRQIGIVLGDHIGEIGLLPEHGVQTDPDRSGHFALYEYDGVYLAAIAVLGGLLQDD
jgi:hypothetical protein